MISRFKWLRLGSHHLWCKGFYFVVVQVSSKELEFDKGYLVEQVVAVFVVSVQQKFEEVASSAEAYRFLFARLKTGLLVPIKREVSKSLEDYIVF